MSTDRVTVRTLGQVHEVSFSVTAKCASCGAQASAATPEAALALVKHYPARHKGAS